MTAAIIGVLAIAAASVYLFPSNSGQGQPGPVASTSTTSLELITSTTSYNGNLAEVTTTTSPSGGPPGGGAQTGWDSGLVVNTTLYSPGVLSYVKSAYDYGVIGISSPADNPNLVNVIVNITGIQSVVGNWTTGYVITYSGLRILNVTVEFTKPSSYSVVSVNLTSLPNRTESINFTPQQQEVIRVALSNSTVRSFMADRGVASYYVPGVMQFPIANGTFGGDYYLSFSLINGVKGIGIYVNSNITAVVEATEASSGGEVCYYPSALCFTDPWNSTG